MLKIQKNFSLDIPYQFPQEKSMSLDDLLFFDIETTGFLADISNIYLIGCCFYHNNKFHLLQWFADDYISEKEILLSFIELASQYKFLVHYNGSTFDVPYIQKKLVQYNLSDSISSMEQIDLYKRISPYKTILSLPNLKQKTIEAYFQIQRKDMYSGGELIDVYVSYMKDKFMKHSNIDVHLQKLLLHNEEDVINLVNLLSILAYQDLFDDKHPINNVTQTQTTLELLCSLNNPIPVAFSYSDSNISIRANQIKLIIEVPILNGELKYFYPDYKDYYYLPLEDTAIHKSVAEFVDKSHRVKAKASTCYTKRQGQFLPQFLGKLAPAFQLEYKDKNSYIELNDSLLGNSDKLSTYVNSILQYSRNIKRRC